MLTREMINEVKQLVEHYTREVNKMYFMKMAVPTVLFTKRGTGAGCARHSDHSVNYNAGLLVENFEQFKTRTIPHEVAHLAVRAKYGKNAKSHGYEWRLMMASLGCDITRCHKYDVTNHKIPKAKTTYTYHCNCKSFELSASRHGKIGRGAKYTCKLCKGVLIFSGQKKRIEPTKHVNTVPRVPVAHALPATGSKVARARQIIGQYPSAPRSQIIEMFISDVGLTKAGASTYYSNLTKKSA